MRPAITRLLMLALVLCASVSFAQKEKVPNAVPKADKDFKKLAYIDAREVYLEVVNDGYESAEIFKKLGDTYYWNSNYGKASIWYQKLLNRFPGEAGAEYFYRAAQALKSVNGDSDRYNRSDKLMQVYASIGGDSLIINNFNRDQDYLTSIEKNSKKYTLEKVSVNSALSDFGPSFYGNKVVYASASQAGDEPRIYEWTSQPYLDLFVADMDAEGKLSNATSLPGDINTKYHESSTTFSKDGKTVYFTRNNFTDGKKGRDKEKTIRLKLYRATKSGDNFWTNVVELPFNGDEYSVSHPALSVDGEKLYFASDMPGTLGMSDLWYVEITGDNTYSTPTNLGPLINTGARETFPYISDANNLYFSTDGRSGLGGFDIYVTPLDETGNVGDITNVGEPANSNQDDFGFILNEDTGIGYLTSNRDGADGGSKGDEIYRVNDRCVITIVGTVFDAETKALLPGAEVSFLDKDNKLIEKVTVGADAAYSFEADCDMQYTIRGTKEDYSPNEKVVETPGKTGTIEVPIPLKNAGGPCPPDDLNCILCIQPIFFDFDKWNIRPDAEVELAKVLAAMRKYPEIIIHIESHTDSRANNDYNDALSERRAQATLDWLVDKGIDRNRLTAKGYGERQLLNRCIRFDECGKEIGVYDCTQKQLDNPKCSDGVDCSKEEHQLNRRSMFIIQN